MEVTASRETRSPVVEGLKTMASAHVLPVATLVQLWLAEKSESELVTPETVRLAVPVLVSVISVAALIVPFFMLSQQELAPAEDQGVVFSAILASENSTIDQTTMFTRQVLDVYRSFPEADSLIQITAPAGGFGGMVTKPWRERSKTTQQILLELMAPL